MHKYLRSTYLPVCNKQIAAATVITLYYSSLLNVQILTLCFVKFLKEVRVSKNALGYFLNFFFRDTDNVSIGKSVLAVSVSKKPVQKTYSENIEAVYLCATYPDSVKFSMRCF